MENERPSFCKGSHTYRASIFHKRHIRNRRRVFRLPRQFNTDASDSRFVNPKRISAQTKLRGKSKEGGRSPLLGRFKGIAKGEIEIPLCYSFFRPSTALSFSYEKESGVETASTDAFRIGAKYASFGGKKKGPSFSGEAPYFRTQTLNRKFTTSPSCMTYSLPSLRSRPFALALASVPQALRSSKAMTSARMKPRSKSE